MQRTRQRGLTGLSLLPRCLLQRQQAQVWNRALCRVALSAIYSGPCSSRFQYLFMARTLPPPSMPSLALQFRAEPHHAPHATSFSTLSTTNTQTAVSPIKGTMQSTESIQTTNIEELSDFARLIASLNDERLRQYARGVKLEGTALVHFTIDRHKDLRNYVYNMSKVCCDFFFET
jgi:hypothetical protein